MGAWIETADKTTDHATFKVAPHVGAWIETQAGWKNAGTQQLSHPMWVRGLKH